MVELASQGQSNPEIASELLMSRNSVKSHLSQAYLKFGPFNRSELASLATSRSISVHDE